MYFVDENYKTIIVETAYDPVISEYMFVLDLEIRDYTLAPIHFLEEYITPTMTVLIDDFYFDLPANWNVLVSDEETLKIDVVSISELAGKDYTVFVYGLNLPRPLFKNIKIVDYKSSAKNATPSLTKNQMLCHPISEKEWINISPSDSYSKYLKDVDLNDILY